MLKPLFIFHNILISLILFFSFSSATAAEKAEKTPIVITSQTLTAESNNKTAVFEGSVVATKEDLTIYSDKMTVFYDNSESKIRKIYAVGNVKAHKNERVIFSDEATYMENEKKIIFTGNPRAVEGENVVSGTQITLYLEDERAYVEGSRVILQDQKGPK
jgi:lipopolysaccharide export system protein LptA